MPRAIQYRCTYDGWVVVYDDDLTELEAVMKDLGISSDVDEDHGETEIEILQVVKLTEEG